MSPRPALATATMLASRTAPAHHVRAASSYPAFSSRTLGTSGRVSSRPASASQRAGAASRTLGRADPAQIHRRTFGFSSIAASSSMPAVVAAAGAAQAQPSGPNDLLVVGPGVLGSYLGKLWTEAFPGAAVAGQTNTPTNHPRQAAGRMVPTALWPLRLCTTPPVHHCMRWGGRGRQARRRGWPPLPLPRCSRLAFSACLSREAPLTQG
jgi:hypothetical protein